MMARSDFHQTAYDDFARALAIDPVDPAALDGFAQAAIMARRTADALERLPPSSEGRPETAAFLLARSKILAAAGASDAALAAAERAESLPGGAAAALEQQASLVADAGDAAQLDLIVSELRQRAPDAPATHYFAAVARFLRDDSRGALTLAERAIAANAGYAPVYDLAGAAHTKLGDTAAARRAFEASLGFNAHDSAAYANLGLLELTAGNRAAAADYFAEALWLDPESPLARQGLAQARGR
jgi:tetratricopeptide (TPR) repeat protein